MKKSTEEKNDLSITSKFFEGCLLQKFIATYPFYGYCDKLMKKLTQCGLYTLNFGKQAFQKTSFLENMVSKRLSTRHTKVTEPAIFVSLNEKITNLLLSYIKNLNCLYIILEKIHIVSPFRGYCVNLRKSSQILSIVKTFTKILGNFHNSMKPSSSSENQRSILTARKWIG